jgi:hypothetical protein
VVSRDGAAQCSRLRDCPCQLLAQSGHAANTYKCLTWR